MALFSRSVSVACCLLLVLLATEMGAMTVEGRDCDVKSELFKGMCFSSDNCANICKEESKKYGGGHCRGWRRQCFCITHC